MAWKTVSYKLTSDCSMIVHNGQTADPLNRWTKAIKKVSGKRSKTDADYEEMAHLEFLAGLYPGPEGPVIPAPNIDAMILNAAKKTREGPLAKAGAFCVEDAAMEYDGPRDVEKLWEDERFRHVAIVRVGTARVARTRPVFKQWSAVVKINLEESVVNVTQLDQWMQTAGTQVGLGDWRPQHGRFTAKRLNG